MAPLLEVAGVDKSFGVKVVDDLSLQVDAGDALGIVGPNGAGKTTLLNLIAGDLSCDRGSIRIEGEDVTRTSSDWRCRHGLARTAQIPRPFEGMTVFENVLVGAVFGAGVPTSEANATPAAVEALERSKLLASANTRAGALPLLGRKRLELARALATRPKILLLDEIAGGLTEAEVLELVETIKAIHADGVTIVWIEHIVHALLAVVGRIMAMSFGMKIAEGDPAEVMASPEVQEVYLGVAPE
ncbi:MAG: ABC transporter ATP-binding protein [Acidimicrobiaceae bacterium]|nr:ABC transporter ATP-binding protein [Acidimicrobiaceae bacterium]MYE56816.1 ABC transporter ATP-binding protein [Acidimicrobiaceae bacterium]